MPGAGVDLKNLAALSIPELLLVHGAVLEELRKRSVLRSKNNPTGDYAEWLVSTRLKLTLKGNSTKGFDATDGTGTRYQIKARRVTPENPSTQLGLIRNLEEREFDFLIAVVFDANWHVIRAAKIPHEILGTLATFRSHTNGYVMHLRQVVFGVSGVEDVTAALSN